MQVILSHTNLDFDGLASMVAAGKLYPEAHTVLPEKLQESVEHFLAIYKDTFSFTHENRVNWGTVTDVILVDISTLERTGRIAKKLPENINVICFDHHEASTHQYPGTYLPYGACVTILLEQIQERSLPVSAFEATLFTLGLYADTGNFTYNSTKPEDLLAGYHMLKSGASLDVAEKFRDTPLSEGEQHLFRTLLNKSKRKELDGTSVLITCHKQNHYTGNLAGIASKLMSLTGADALFALVKMEDKTFITARAASDRISVLPVIEALGGGGHQKAASAMRKDTDPVMLAEELELQLSSLISSTQTAKEIMSSPVRVVAPDTSVEDVSKMLFRYGHTGFPVVDKEKLVGIISRRDADKALHHGLGHAPVKGYMSNNPVSITSDTSVSDIQSIMIDKNVGRLPVLENGEVAGIVSRTDVIRTIHNKNTKPLNNTADEFTVNKKIDLTDVLASHFNKDLFNLVRIIGEQADKLGMKAYLIGGIVRDLLLERPNEDIDIVVEGNAIVLGEALTGEYGGSIRSHETFKTATWSHHDGLKIDLTSARTEYYDFPAALPNVELSNIKEDLYRRDFTINALAMSLSSGDFGTLLDFFHGYEDIRNGQIRVLYNLSFLEDPTRILRALRFENRFLFKMDNETEEFAKTHKKMLSSVSKPRLANEVKKVITEEDLIRFVKRASELDLLSHLLNTHEDTVTVLKRLQCFNEIRDRLTRDKLHPSHWLGVLLLMTDLSREAFEECLGFAKNKQDEKLLSEVYRFYQTYDFKFHSLYDWHAVCSEVSLEAITVCLSLCHHDSFIVEQGTEYLIKRDSVTHTISGTDLIDLGFKPGPHFKTWLLQLEASKIENPSLSKEELLEYARHVFSDSADEK
ncbi:CBS domain-containing protein [Alteribacter keqinensis]|nr:CBS domain-containing protein [Alteribacter keqinensis]